MMKRRPTRADVASQAGVSKTTVTYVLGDRHDISIPEATRERVRSVARQLGYRPHAAAQALALGRTNTVTVAFPIRIGAHYAHLLQAFERQTNDHGYHMVASTVGHVDIANVRPDLSSLMTNLTDGIILVDMPAAFRPYIDGALSADKPIVSVGVFTVPSIDCIEVNLEQGAVDALRHLLASDPRRVGFFAPGMVDERSVVDTYAAPGTLDPRISAYCRTMQEAGRPYEIIAGNAGSRRASMEALKAYIAERGCPDALFCFNDEMAVGASRALRESGIRVPQDVLLVGCDGTEEGEYMNPPLSTIVQPVDKMCSLAWEFITNRLNDPGIAQQYSLVDAQFIRRKSSERA